MIETVIRKFRDLRLKNCAENIDNMIKQAEQNNLSVLQTIDRLLDHEIEARKKARVVLRYRQSKLTEKPTIDQFDFKYHASRKKQKNQIINLKGVEKNR